jgi:hypothetical protein
MRLLEFSQDRSVANPNPANTVPSTPRPLPDAAKPTPKSPEISDLPPSPANKVRRNRSPRSTKPARKTRAFQLKSAPPAPVTHKPIDLEHLQQRVSVLERRIKARAAALDDDVAARDLEKLKQRVKLLERSINSELWAAKQREYTILQLMAKPTFKTALRQGLIKLISQTLPESVQSLRNWWLQSQPVWWTSIASAWKESLDNARGHNRH